MTAPLAIQEAAVRRAARTARRRLTGGTGTHEDLVTEAEAAALVGISPRHVRSMIRCGYLVAADRRAAWAPRSTGALLRLADVDRLADVWDRRGAPAAFAPAWATRAPDPDAAAVIEIGVDALADALARFCERVADAAVDARSQLSIPETAAMLGVTTRSVRRMVARGDLVERVTAVSGSPPSIDRASVECAVAAGRGKLSP